MNRINRVGRQALWFALQIGVFAFIVSWATSPEMQETGGSNPYAVGVFALLMTMAATAAVMIFRDTVTWLWRWLVHGETQWTGARLFGPSRPLRKPHQPNDGTSRIDASPGPRHPRELPPGSRVRKQIR